MTLINAPHHPNDIARAGGRHQPVAVPVTDRREIRQIFGRFATGITVVTAGRETPRGMTANSFTSVSLDPPLVLVCVQRDNTMHETIHDHRAFVISVLAAHQEQVARLFADNRRARGAEFETIDTIPGPHTGAPIMAGALAWLECELVTVYDGGDHSIFIGEVQTIGRSSNDHALLFYDGGFHRLEPQVALRQTA